MLNLNLLERGFPQHPQPRTRASLTKAYAHTCTCVMRPGYRYAPAPPPPRDAPDDQRQVPTRHATGVSQGAGGADERPTT
eukprot:6422467-Prymnesium_polylepis.1